MAQKCRTAGFWLTSALLLGGVVACGGGRTDPCSNVGAVTTSNTRLLILVDHTADAYDANTLPQGVTDDIKATLKKKDGAVSLGVIQGVSDPQDLLPDGLSDLGLIKRDNNSANLDDQIRDAETCISNRYQGIVPSQPGSDILGAINGSTRILDGASKQTIDVVSNGLANAGTLDLRKLLSADMTADDTADYVRNEVDLSHLPGYQVTFYGLGDVTSSRSQPTMERRAWLGQFWIRLCQDAGATCKQDNWIARGKPAKGAPADAEIQFAPETAPSLTPSASPSSSPTSPSCQISLPAEELFGPGSAALTSKANSDLTPVADKIRSEPQAKVKIEGHTATWGSEQYRANLSLSRATAVRDRLVQLGVPAGQLLPPKGLGSTQQVAVDTDGSGNLIEPQASMNRRIVITYLNQCGASNGTP